MYLAYHGDYFIFEYFSACVIIVRVAVDIVASLLDRHRRGVLQQAPVVDAAGVSHTINFIHGLLDTVANLKT